LESNYSVLNLYYAADLLHWQTGNPHKSRATAAESDKVLCAGDDREGKRQR
jgi:hypothetical protein